MRSGYAVDLQFVQQTDWDDCVSGVTRVARVGGADPELKRRAAEKLQWFKYRRDAHRWLLRSAGVPTAARAYHAQNPERVQCGYFMICPGATSSTYYHSLMHMSYDIFVENIRINRRLFPGGPLPRSARCSQYESAERWSRHVRRSMFNSQCEAAKFGPGGVAQRRACAAGRDII